MRWARFRRPGATGAWLVHLRDKRELQWLGIFTEGLRDEHLEFIAGLDGLETLLLRSPALTDAGMIHLRGLTGLKRLWIDNSQVTGNGLEHIRGLGNLERIALPPTVDA
jgi:hypothetical protein